VALEVEIVLGNFSLQVDINNTDKILRLPPFATKDDFIEAGV